MNKYITLIFVVLFAACSTPSRGPAPAPSETAAASVVATTPVTSPSMYLDRRHAPIVFAPLKAKTPLPPDTSPYAACRRSDGSWACPSIKPLLATGNGTPGNCGSVCGITDWYLDPQNLSGVASDANSCTAATGAAGTGVGPCLTMKQIVSRYGTSSPQINYGVSVTVHQLSKQISSSDSFYFDPKLSGGGNFVWLATPSLVGAPFSPTTVTAMVQTAVGNDLKLNGNLPVAAAAGQIVHDITKNSYAIIDAVSAGSAIMQQPFAAAGLTTVTDIPVLVVDNTWANTDSYQLLQPLDVFWKNPMPNGGDVDAATQTQGVAWIQGVHFVDVSGIVGFSEVVVRAAGCASVLSLCSFDPFLLYDAVLAYQGTMAACFANGGGEFIGNLARVIGGSVGLNGYVTEGWSASFDGNVIIHGSLKMFSSDNNLVQVHNAGFIVVQDGAVCDITAGALIWGSGTIDVTEASVLINQTGGLWANCLKVSTLEIGQGLTTASSFNSAAVGNPFTPGITITSANLDTGGGAGNPGLQNPRTGGRYSSL